MDGESELAKTVDKKYCSISELMDHVIEEPKRLYQGKQYENSFSINHDALSIS